MSRVPPIGDSMNRVPPISDSYAYQSYQRQRQMTLGDLLLENRIVFLQGEIYTGNANEVVMKLLYLQSENRRKDIHFYLNSPGGDVVATLAIYDTMQILSCPSPPTAWARPPAALRYCWRGERRGNDSPCLTHASCCTNPTAVSAAR